MRNKRLMITIVTDWIQYTVAVTGVGTITLTESFYMRQGDSIFVRGRFALGITAASGVSLSLPTGLVIDSKKELSTALYGLLVNQAAATQFSVLGAGDGTTLSVGSLAANPLSIVLGTTLGAAADTVSFIAGPIPIAGWKPFKSVVL